MISWKSLLLLFIVLQLYLIIGMIALHFLEITRELGNHSRVKSENEEVVRYDTSRYKDYILRNYTCLSEKDLDALIGVIAKAIHNGVDPTQNATSKVTNNWEYHHAFFFSGTVITTIGYGHISPSTRGGQTFCIIYALIGIPICGILLSALGDIFYKFKDRLLGIMYEKLDKKWQRKTLSLLFMCGLGMLFFIMIPSAIFTAVEDWTYHQSIYYCFISLTTIGFGDFVVGQNPDISYPSMYKIMCLYWILLGLVYLAIIIQDISDAFSSRVEKVDKRIEKADSVHAAEKGNLADKKSDSSDNSESNDKVDEKSTDVDNKLVINEHNGQGGDTYM